VPAEQLVQVAIEMAPVTVEMVPPGQAMHDVADGDPWFGL
jgi:hypothetical protein